MRPRLKKYFILALCLSAGARAQIYNYFSPGCALSGTALSQTVNLNTGACISGNLAIANLNGGTGASAATYFRGDNSWATPSGVPSGSSGQVQFNFLGAFSGSSAFTWNNGSSILGVGAGSTSSTGTITVGGSSTGTGLVQGGAQLTVQGNPLVLTTTNGSSLSVAGSAGSGAGAGSSITVTGGNTGATSTSAGGSVTIAGGQGNGSVASGNSTLGGGPGFSTTGTAGNAVVQGGLGNTQALSGKISLVTNNSTRLTIDNFGAWNLAGSTGSTNQVFTSQGAGAAPIWSSVSSPIGANPSGTIGLSAINGSATTFMRSDAAPPLSQSIAPTMTGNWTHTPASGTAITINAASGNSGLLINGQSASSTIPASLMTAGTISGLGVVTDVLRLRPAAGAAYAGNGAALMIDSVSNNSTLLPIAGVWSSLYAGGSGGANTDQAGYLALASKAATNTTGPAVRFYVGDQGLFAAGLTSTIGAGTGNFTGLYINNVPINNAAAANPSASVGLSAVNGSATTFMRSDAAPPLSQSIAPTMTGNWTYAPSSGVAVTLTASSGNPAMVASAGTSAAASYAFAGSPGAGMWSGATNEIDFATTGVNRLSLTSAGNANFSGSIIAGGYSGGPISGTTESLSGALSFGPIASTIKIQPFGSGGTLQSAFQYFTDNNLYVDAPITGTPTGGATIFRTGSTGALNTLVLEADGGIVAGASTDEGVGTINARGLFVNGVAVETATGATKTFSFTAGFSPGTVGIITCVGCGTSPSFARVTSGSYTFTAGSGISWASAVPTCAFQGAAGQIQYFISTGSINPTSPTFNISILSATGAGADPGYAAAVSCFVAYN